MTMSTQQDATQASTGSDDGFHAEPGTPALAYRPAVRSLAKVHAGRLVVASVAALLLVAASVTFVLGIFNIVPLLVPLGCFLLGAASIALLRTLAVRSRRARVQRAFADAMAPVRWTEPSPISIPPIIPQRPTHLFDADASITRPPTAMERRTASLAATRSFSTKDAAVARTGSPAGSTAWVPVDVPRPTYIDAAKAERGAPAPLDLPEAPRPASRMPIKTAEAAARALPADEEKSVTPDSTAPATGRINLDDVLQRRRA